VRERSRAYALLLRAGWSGCPAWPGVEVVEALVFLLAAARSGGSSSGSANGEATDSAARQGQGRGGGAGPGGQAARCGRGAGGWPGVLGTGTARYSTAPRTFRLGFFSKRLPFRCRVRAGFRGIFPAGKAWMQ